MNIWIVNPFDPLPGDPEQEGRYASLVRLLAAGGHKVTWWTSAFSHRFKRPVDQQALVAACGELGIDAQFIEAPAYARNVSFRRLWNHRVLARRFRRRAALRTDRPDVVVVSVPPPMLAREACRFAKARGAGIVVDCQDLWPETFYRLGPAAARAVKRLAFRPWASAAAQSYRLADAAVGVADGYVQRVIELGGPKKHSATIPLGVDLAAFDAAATAGVCDRFAKPPGQVWLAYTGSLNQSYDPLTIIRAAARLGERAGEFRLFVTGRGELRAEAEAIVQDEAVENVTLTGFLDFDQWAYLLSQCDAGFNASFASAMIYLPNKIFYYLAAGAAVLNTIPGQCGRIVQEGDCGLNYTAGDVTGCAAAIARVLDDSAATAEMKRQSRHLAETVYDRAVFMPRYVELIERVGAEHPSSPG